MLPHPHTPPYNLEGYREGVRNSSLDHWALGKALNAGVAALTFPHCKHIGATCVTCRPATSKHGVKSQDSHFWSPPTRFPAPSACVPPEMFRVGASKAVVCLSLHTGSWPTAFCNRSLAGISFSRYTLHFGGVSKPARGALLQRLLLLVRKTCVLGHLAGSWPCARPEVCSRRAWRYTCAFLNWLCLGSLSPCLFFIEGGESALLLLICIFEILFHEHALFV